LKEKRFLFFLFCFYLAVAIVSCFGLGTPLILMHTLWFSEAGLFCGLLNFGMFGFSASLSFSWAKASFISKLLGISQQF
jgi:hypothetical protein